MLEASIASFKGDTSKLAVLIRDNLSSLGEEPVIPKKSPRNRHGTALTSDAPPWFSNFSKWVTMDNSREIKMAYDFLDRLRRDGVMHPPDVVAVSSLACVLTLKARWPLTAKTTA